MMKTFLSAVALLLILEGIPYFAAPETARRVLARLLASRTGMLRGMGFAMIALGLAGMALIRAVMQ